MFCSPTTPHTEKDVNLPITPLIILLFFLLLLGDCFEIVSEQLVPIFFFSFFLLIFFFVIMAPTRDCSIDVLHGCRGFWLGAMEMNNGNCLAH